MTTAAASTNKTNGARETTGDSDITELSTTDLLSGILIYSTQQLAKFPEQAVYAFFSELGHRYPPLADRFRVQGNPGNFSSVPLRQVLSFLEMGKILELPMPNPVGQYFKPRASQMDSLRALLEEREVLPRYDALLRQLAVHFVQTAKAVQTVNHK